MIKDRIIKAYNFAEKAHEGVTRKFSGLPYFSHPKGVARIVQKLTEDEILIIVSFCHDLVEDTDITIEEIRELFGDEVADLVLELTSDPVHVKLLGKKVYLSMKMVEMSSRALIIKLADRLHNILYLQGDATPLKFIRKYYKETRFIMMRLRDDYSELNDYHKILMSRIDIVLDFLEMRHRLDEEK
jgi:(p)ppGpp synthase/HD superfamily hydrolase